MIELIILYFMSMFNSCETTVDNFKICDEKTAVNLIDLGCDPIAFTDDKVLLSCDNIDEFTSPKTRCYAVYIPSLDQVFVRCCLDYGNRYVCNSAFCEPNTNPPVCVSGNF